MEKSGSLILKLVSNILVKGSDYLTEIIVGADVVQEAAGVVKRIGFVPRLLYRSVL